MIHTKAEEERERRARKRRAEEAALSENSNVYSWRGTVQSKTKRALASLSSESGPGGMPLSGGTPSSQPIWKEIIKTQENRCGAWEQVAWCAVRHPYGARYVSYSSNSDYFQVTSPG